MNSLAAHWSLNPEIAFLNHGSFGACPRPVLEAQSEWRERMEREPVRFFVRDLEGELDHVREVVGAFVGANPEDLAFVTNATTGVNAVLGSLSFEPGDEVLCTSHGYKAVANTLAYTAERSGARVVVADVPFPITGPDEVLERVLAAVTERTRLCVIDHVTSPTGLVFPVAQIVKALEARGIDTLVDGAHAPGQLALDLRALGAAYYTGNFHKWVCSPKSSALLHVRRDRRDRIRPTVVSHGRSSPRKDRSRFQLEFDWTGTIDASAVLSVPAALTFLGGLLPGGWDELRARNRALALSARRVLASAIGCPLPSPDDMIACLAALPLPDARETRVLSSAQYPDALQDVLTEQHRIQVPIMPWPRAPHRLVRISAQLYNELPQYERLAFALRSALG